MASDLEKLAKLMIDLKEPRAQVVIITHELDFVTRRLKEIIEPIEAECCNAIEERR